MDYDFMRGRAVHFGVYSENGMKNIQNELAELLRLMAGDPVYEQYKPSLLDMYHAVRRRNDISSFFPVIRKVRDKTRKGKFVSDILVYVLSASALVMAGTLPVILKL